MAEDAWRRRQTRDERERAMTMPHLMNCAHSAEGWCLECVGHLHSEVQNAQQARASSGAQACQDGQALDVARTPEGEPLGSHLARLARKHDLSDDLKAAIRQAAELLSVPGVVLPGAQHGLSEEQEPKYTVNGGRSSTAQAARRSRLMNRFSSSGRATSMPCMHCAATFCACPQVRSTGGRSRLAAWTSSTSRRHISIA